MIGIDIVDIARIGRLRERYGRTFLAKVFTEHEIAYATAKKRCDESLAARFAAKEAFMKAKGRLLPFKAIEIRSSEEGKPFILFEGKRFDEVSLTHERAYAAAVVVI